MLYLENQLLKYSLNIFRISERKEVFVMEKTVKTFTAQSHLATVPRQNKFSFTDRTSLHDAENTVEMKAVSSDDTKRDARRDKAEMLLITAAAVLVPAVIGQILYLFL